MNDIPKKSEKSYLKLFTKSMKTNQILKENLKPIMERDNQSLNSINTSTNFIIKKDEIVSKIKQSKSLKGKVSNKFSMNFKKFNSKVATNYDNKSQNSNAFFKQSSEVQKPKESFMDKIIYTIFTNNEALKENVSDTKSTKINWSKEKLEEIWKKIKITKIKILEKTRKDFQEIRENIINGEKEIVLSKLRDPKFKKFYKLDLKNNELTNFMIKSRKCDILREVLKDKFYNFNVNIIFDFFKKFLIEKTKNDEDVLILHDIITNGFFNIEHSIIIAFLLSLFHCFDLFKLIIMNEKMKNYKFSEENHTFHNEASIISFSESHEVYYEILKLCFEFGFEDLSILIFNYFSFLDNSQVILSSIRHNCLKFLKYIWEYQSFRKPDPQNSRINNANSFKSVRSNRSEFGITQFQDLKCSSNLQNIVDSKVPFDLSFLVSKFAELRNLSAIRSLLNWKGIESDQNLFQTLFDNKCFDEIGAMLFKRKAYKKWKITVDQFVTTIENEELELLLFFVKFKDCKNVLNDHKIQSLILEKYLHSGDKIYYAAELLSYIDKFYWDTNLTRNFCKLISKLMKKRELINSHSPLLTLLLICEFLSKISNLSVFDQSKCNQLSEELLLLAKQIQISNPDEVYIKHIMSQTDSRGRNCFEIAADNEFFSVLETEEIGTIVGKLWNGNISHNSFLNASSLFQYLNESHKHIDPFYNFDSLDQSKKFIFQVSVWVDSCKLRFFPDSIVSFFTVIVYTAYITNIVHLNLIPISVKDLVKTNPDVVFLLLVYNFLMISFFLNDLNQLLYLYVSGKKIKIYFWHITDTINMVFSLVLLVDFYNIFGIDYYDPNSTGQDYTNPAKIVYLIRVGIIVLNNILVWTKLTRICMTFKGIGRFLKMVYEMSIKISKYVVLYMIWVLCFSAVFTVLFFDWNPNFSDYNLSVFTLIGGFIQNFNLKNFSNFTIFGEVLLILYVIFSGILLINLLISILSGFYDELSEIVDGSHRAVLINYLKIYKWDKKYGFLIFLAPPFNLVNIITFPLILLFSDEYKKSLNIVILKFYYSLYFFVIFMFYASITMVFIPFTFIKGLIFAISSQSKLSIHLFLKVYLVFRWLILGPFYLIFIYLRDLYIMMILTFFEKSKDKKISRLKEYISPDEFLIFIEFIYQRLPSDSLDIHELFQNYIKFEHNHNLEKEEFFIDKSIVRKSKIGSRSLYSSLYFSRKENSINPYKFVKKNMIIIEILENFLINDIYKKTSYVDLNKMRMIVPKTMNINYRYIKRLFYTDMNALNIAYNSMKNYQEGFNQYQLMKKINAKIIKIDKEIDHYIRKTFSKSIHKGSFDEYDDFELLDDLFDDISNYVEINKEQLKFLENNK